MVDDRTCDIRSVLPSMTEFCTEWPSTLDSDVRCEEHFPIQMETKDFVFAGPSLRNPTSRVVRLKVRMDGPGGSDWWMFYSA